MERSQAQPSTAAKSEAVTATHEPKSASSIVAAIRSLTFSDEDWAAAEDAWGRAFQEGR